MRCHLPVQPLRADDQAHSPVRARRRRSRLSSHSDCYRPVLEKLEDRTMLTAGSDLHAALDSVFPALSTTVINLGSGGNTSTSVWLAGRTP
jgi:hypothetical protein